MKRGAVKAFRIGRNLRKALGDDFRKRGEEGVMVCFWHNNFLWIGKVAALFQLPDDAGNMKTRVEYGFVLRSVE